MSTPDTSIDAASAAYDANAKQKSQAKTSRIPIKVVAAPALKKPEWIRVKAGSPSTRFYEIKSILREHRLHTVCEEASCPNIGECFGKGTATFMIMGDKCTRRCPFCDVGHGRPDPLDADEPLNLARTIAALKLKYVVITSVDRDDLRDGGARHFAECIRAVRGLSPQTRIEVLVPDFRGRLERALEVLSAAPPDVMNHNMETVPRLYKQARPGGDYAHSLGLFSAFKRQDPATPTKSGLMVGLGETDDEILAELLPRFLKTQLFGALLENQASEQGASMTAMDNATRNAGDLINKLTIQYNRSRQAAITTELIEIIAGAEAL